MNIENKTKIFSKHLKIQQSKIIDEEYQFRDLLKKNIFVVLHISEGVTVNDKFCGKTVAICKKMLETEIKSIYLHDTANWNN